MFNWSAFHLDCTPIIPVCRFYNCVKCMEEMKAVLAGTPGVRAFYRESHGVVVEYDASVVTVERLLEVFRGLPSFYENHFVPSIMENRGIQQD